MGERRADKAWRPAENGAEKLNDTEVIDAITREINEDLDIPFTPEKKEGEWIREGVEWIMDKLDEVLPERFVDYIFDAAADGLKKGDWSAVKASLVDDLSSELNLPGKLIAVVIDIVFSFARKGSAITDILT